MDPAQVLGEAADEIAQQMQGRARTLEAELRDIEKRKLEVETKLDAAKRAKQRLLNYRPGSGSKFECPGCWVYNEVRPPLTAIPGTDEYDVLRCHACGADWQIPLG